jgi:hypothetical protein
MKDFPVGGLLDEDGLSDPVFVAHGDIVVEGELKRGGNHASFAVFSNDYVIPFLLATLFCQL